MCYPPVAPQYILASVGAGPWGGGTATPRRLCTCSSSTVPETGVGGSTAVARKRKLVLQSPRPCPVSIAEKSPAGLLSLQGLVQVRSCQTAVLKEQHWMEFLVASGTPAVAACGESQLSRDLLHPSPSSKVGGTVSTESLIPSHQTLFL